MPFWSGETLAENLSSVIDKPNKENIDCSAYTLSVGPEYYVTPSDRTSDPHATSLRRLAEGQAFSIPAGQFGYLLTEEVVSVPKGALAFISIKARIKFRGLINVSGFHVDPGYHGRLLFAVFNAGPTQIHLRRGDPTFLIWFADLDNSSSQYTKPPAPQMSQIDLSIVNHVAGEVYSIQGLKDKISTTEKELAIRITALERENGIIKVLAGAMLTVIIALCVQWVAKEIWPAKLPAAVTSTPATPQTSLAVPPRDAASSTSSK